MGVSYSIKGLKPITETYRKKLAIYNMCKELNITPPDEILKYFEDEIEPCEDGMIVNLTSDAINVHYNNNLSYKYFDVDLSKIQKDVTKIRFEISY